MEHIQKMNTCTKLIMIVYKLIFGMFVIVAVLYGTWRMRERKREWQAINNITKHNICVGLGYKHVY
jgi:cytochrome oxidase assembly protein ShyY1